MGTAGTKEAEPAAAVHDAAKPRRPSAVDTTRKRFAEFCSVLDTAGEIDRSGDYKTAFVRYQAALEAMIPLIKGAALA